MCRLLTTYIVCKCPQQNKPTCPHHNNLRENQPDAGGRLIHKPGPDGRDDWLVRSPDEEQTCDKWSPFQTTWEPCATYLSEPKHWREDGTLVRWFEAMCEETAQHKVKRGMDGHEKKITIRLLCPLCFRGHGDDELALAGRDSIKVEGAGSQDRSAPLARDGDGGEFLASVLSSGIDLITVGLDRVKLEDSPSYWYTKGENEDEVDSSDTEVFYSSAAKEEYDGVKEEDDGCRKVTEATPVQKEEPESTPDSDATEVIHIGN